MRAPLMASLCCVPTSYGSRADNLHVNAGPYTCLKRFSDPEPCTLNPTPEKTLVMQDQLRARCCNDFAGLRNPDNLVGV